MGCVIFFLQTLFTLMCSHAGLLKSIFFSCSYELSSDFCVHFLFSVSSLIVTDWEKKNNASYV